ncbi:MAG: M23 family metallopeptidase [Spirochaetaceae bacterium]|nr:M23 family metallopeptidase [Spirochaetaceae bacterium]
MVKIVHFLLLLLVAIQLPAQAYIQNLERSDFLFNTLINDIAENNRRFANRREPLPLIFYSYSPKNGETLQRIAARLNISYDSIASLNGLSGPNLPTGITTIFIPNMSGLAINSAYSEDIFWRDIAGRLNGDNYLQGFLYNDGMQIINFFPNERFTQSERRIFLSDTFRAPLNGTLVITSPFGQRPDPFGSPRGHHHNGIDLRAEPYSPVLAARAGEVTTIASNNVLGLYIIITHSGGYQSLYGHLSSARVNLGQRVNAGALIALSGYSGAITGPHLHFEIRLNGSPVNPTIFLNIN